MEITEPLISLDQYGAHVRSKEVADKLAKKNLSPSLITGLNDCAARWLANTFVVRDLVEEEPDNAARRGSIFHKVMEDLFLLEPDERTPAMVRELVNQTLASEEFRDLEHNTDVITWLRSAINNYYSMGADPRKVQVAEVALNTKPGKDPEPRKGIEVFVKGTLGNSKRPILGFIDRLVLDTRCDDGSLVVEDWKGLALDTPIATPKGWTTMADLAVGDEVFGTRGHPVTVMKKSQVHHRPCYRLAFLDGTSVVCDNEHLWSVVLGDGTDDVVLTADEAFSAWQRGITLHIRNPEPLATPHRELPFNPHEVGRDLTRVPAALAVAALSHHLHLLGSADQRLDLLRGLMDSVGTWDAKTGKVCLPNLGNREASLVVSLVGGLGMASQRTPQGDGTWAITLTPSGTNPVAQNLLAAEMGTPLVTQSAPRGLRPIASITPMESVPTQCIGVDAEDSLYLCGPSLVPTHNTGAKAKEWKSHTKGDEGLAEQRQQLIYKLLLEQQGFKVSAARLIYPVAKTIVNVDLTDKALEARVVRDVEEADQKLDVMIETNLFEFSPSFLCAWCPLAKICPKATIKPYDKMRVAFASQPEPEVLLRGIELD